jgi:hypothetical protein
VPELEPVEAWRVVAAPAALDHAHWEGDDIDVVRVAPDEALVLGATGGHVDDPDAIIEPEAGFSVALLDRGELATVAAHTEWPIPGTEDSPAQGKIAGVPAKLRIGNPTLLVVQTAYVDELRSRLGW